MICLLSVYGIISPIKFQKKGRVDILNDLFLSEYSVDGLL